MEKMRHFCEHSGQDQTKGAWMDVEIPVRSGENGAAKVSIGCDAHLCDVMLQATGILV